MRDSPTPSAFAPARLGGLTLRNRLIRTGAFEGMCPGGRPSEALVEHHRAMAAGGVALTTVAYCSVSADGRTYGTQMLMAPEIVPGLRRITDAVHREGAAASIQLGHCGYFASSRVIGGTPLGASRKFCLYGLAFCRELTEADIERVAGDFVRAARLAREAGFDAVELHGGHGYLLSQFLSPYTNHRTDRWGGSLENRARFPALVVRRVREALGPDVPVLVKTNLTDGFAGGLTVAEAAEAAQHLEAAGATALVLSGGFVSKTPFYMMRGHVPVREMAGNQEQWLHRLGLTLFGRVFVQTFPFTDLFFLEPARVVRKAVRLPLVLVGGVRSRDGIETALGEGFDFVALGRALILDPEFPHRIERGEIRESECDQCNLCVSEMDRGGVRCIPPSERPDWKARR